jgi:hypothetical protein
MKNETKGAISLLRQGKAPDNYEILKRITVESDKLIDFISQKYMGEYISQGGSKIKFVTGKPGSGKTHFLHLISGAAWKQGFVTIHFSAKDIWLHDFKDIYIEIIKQTELENCLKKCAERVITELGYNLNAIPADMSFADYLSSLGEFDALTKKEIRSQLRELFLKNPLIDNNFAIACSLLTGGILGHPVLESANKELLYAWLFGSKEIKLTALRSLGLSPAKITKFNARHMLRSLVEVLRIVSYPGIVVLIDNLEILVNSTSFDTIRYTKLKREDAYESIRELIDEIDTLNGVMFFFAFDKELIDNGLSGVKSYQALWLRIQNEIVSGRFNKFMDIIDLDRYANEFFTKEILLDMSDKVARLINEQSNEGLIRITEAEAEKMLEEASFVKISLPRQVILSTISEIEQTTEGVDYD